jgi:organic radical activating enzyme
LFHWTHNIFSKGCKYANQNAVSEYHSKGKLLFHNFLMTLSNTDQLMADAISLHREGRLAEAQKQYETVLEKNPDFPAAEHNLGMVLLGQGRLRPGVRLVEQALAKQNSFPEIGDTYREVGMTLYHSRHWEDARPWLLKAAVKRPDDSDLRAVLQRIEPRSYLAPEIFDPIAGEVLKRYVPRESPNYVYVIDIMGTCNLRCPTCPVGNFREARRKKGKMVPELFEQIIDQIVREKGIKQTEIWLFNWGEPLLHPDLPLFIQIVHRHGLTCQISSNLNVEQGIKKLAEVDPDVLKISLSGFTTSTYPITHKGGNIHLVKANMYRLRYYLDNFDSTTRVWVGHHQYRSTAAHTNAVRELCNELDFEYQPIQAFYQPLEKLLSLVQGKMDVATDPVLKDLLIHPLHNLAHIRAHRSGMYDCELRFNQTVINFDGSVALCCGVYDEKNMLGVHFMETTLEEREELKYSHPFCGTCRSSGLDYSVSELPDYLTSEQ